MGGSEVERLTRTCVLLDRIATYGWPEPGRTRERADRARTLSVVRTSRGPREVRNWKFRSTAWELVQRCVVDSRNDPSTLPAACRLALVTVSTGLITALSYRPTSEQFDQLDDTTHAVFLAAQGAVAFFVAWYVIALVRHADHLPLRQVGLPSAGIGVCLLVQLVTNQAIVPSDHLYTAYCLLSSVGSFAIAAAAVRAISDSWARKALRFNAAGTLLVGLNVFDWINRTSGAVSVIGAIHVAMICLGVSGTLMLARLPFRRELPVVAADGRP